MKTSKIIKTITLCVLGIGGISSSTHAMQTFVNQGVRHSRGTMYSIHPMIQMRQTHNRIEESAWLCPITITDIDALSQADFELGKCVQEIRNHVIELDNILRKNDDIGYTWARNQDENLRDHFYHLHDLFGLVKKRRKLEDEAMDHAIEALRSSTYHLGCKLNGVTPKPIQTHHVTQTDDDTVTVDLGGELVKKKDSSNNHCIWEITPDVDIPTLLKNEETILAGLGVKSTNRKEEGDFDQPNFESCIKDESISTLQDQDPQLSHLMQTIEEYAIQFDKILMRENKKQNQDFAQIAKDTRSIWLPVFLRLAEKYPHAAKESNFLRAITLDLANALEKLKSTSYSDPIFIMREIENTRLNFEKKAHQLLVMDGIKDDLEFQMAINILRELFNIHAHENGIRRSKE